MMFWLGFFVGLGAASTAALVAWTVLSSGNDPADDASVAASFDLCAQEAGR